MEAWHDRRFRFILLLILWHSGSQRVDRNPLLGRLKKCLGHWFLQEKHGPSLKTMANAIVPPTQ